MPDSCLKFRVARATVSCGLMLVACGPLSTHAQTLMPDDWYIRAITMPSDLAPPDRNYPVVIAIVDDGVRISHEAIRNFIWTNPDEKPGNSIDDDGNGFVDDIRGWDVSDRDGDVAPPVFRTDYNHGTHLASIVGRIALEVYGADAPHYIRILPVKAIADDSPDTYLKDGFRGIEYAIQAKPDIILAAWSVAHISPREEAVLQRAADAGILVIGAGGNWPQEQDMFPAAHAEILAVGSVESNGEKTLNSNYGQFIDILAPGSGIHGASIESDDTYQELDGSSLSAAIVAATAAIAKLQNRLDAPTEIKACLLNTADPVHIERKDFSGKLGAGRLNASAAIGCDVLNTETDSVQTTNRSKGYLRANQRRAEPMSWTIDPRLEIDGFYFRAVRDRKQTESGTIEFRAGPDAEAELIHRFDIDALPDEIYVPGKTAHVTLTPNRRRSIDWLMVYEAKTINFAGLHCRDRVELTMEGRINDGSGSEPYSANSNCQWLITAPPGKAIEFTFDELHIEPNVDKIYFFDGASTNEQIMAILSGGELPPVFTTWRNQVLIWFVTDGETQGNGWQATYQFVDRTN